MLPHMRRTLLLAMAGVMPASAQTPPAMFRGGPEHHGRYAGPPVESFGGLAWRVQTGGPVRSSPTFHEGTVYVGSGDGAVYALDARTGAIAWRAATDAAVTSAAAVTDDAVYVTTLGGGLYALDRATGRERWRAHLGPDAQLAWGRESGDVFSSSPAVVGGILVVGGANSGVYALDAVSGTPRWRAQTGGRVRSSPAVAGGMVYAASFDGHVYAFDLATGTQRWRHATEGASLNSAEFGYDRRSVIASPAVAGGVVYVGARDGHFYALDAATGARRWRIAHDRTSWSIASPAVADSLVYEGSSDARFFHALRRADGKEIWRISTPGIVWSSPALVGGLVYFGTGAGSVLAVDAATGREAWRYQTGGPIHSSPVVAHGVLYVGSVDGGVYALRGGEGAPLRMAVFWDRAATVLSGVRDHTRIRDFLRDRGYEGLDARTLRAWLEARIRSPGPSVVVFAIDHLPQDVAAGSGQGAAFRRYLDTGGKVVWLGIPPLMWPPGATGERSYEGIDPTAPQRLLAVDFSAAQFDRYGTRLLPPGVEWGLTDWWLAAWAVGPAAGLTVLALDERGGAAAWTRGFGGAPGSGFVQLGRSEWPERALLELAGVAERRPF